MKTPKVQTKVHRRLNCLFSDTSSCFIASLSFVDNQCTCEKPVSHQSLARIPGPTYTSLCVYRSWSQSVQVSHCRLFVFCLFVRPSHFKAITTFFNFPHHLPGEKLSPLKEKQNCIHAGFITFHFFSLRNKTAKTSFTIMRILIVESVFVKMFTCCYACI